MIKVLVLPGDGVGPEVTREALRVLRWFIDHRGLKAEITERDFGLVNWQKHGTMMPEETWARIEDADAILFGAVGTLDQKAVPAEERRKGRILLHGEAGLTGQVLGGDERRNALAIAPR